MHKQEETSKAKATAWQLEDLEDRELDHDNLELDLEDPGSDEEDRRQDHFRDVDDPRVGTPTQAKEGKERHYATARAYISKPIHT